jgi:hypothetical protein
MDGMSAHRTPDNQDGSGVERIGPYAREPAIDLVHLAHQTLGDRVLEVELLELFEHQCTRTLSQLTGPAAVEPTLRADVAHTLKGAALAIGAGRVAEASGVYETLSRSGVTPDAGELAVVIAEAVEAITRLREP